MISGSTEYPCIGVSENTFVHTSYFNMHDSSSPPAVPVQMQRSFSNALQVSYNTRPLYVSPSFHGADGSEGETSPVIHVIKALLQASVSSHAACPLIQQACNIWCKLYVHTPIIYITVYNKQSSVIFRKSTIKLISTPLPCMAADQPCI